MNLKITFSFGFQLLEYFYKTDFISNCTLEITKIKYKVWFNNLCIKKNIICDFHIGFPPCFPQTYIKIFVFIYICEHLCTASRKLYFPNTNSVLRMWTLAALFSVFPVSTLWTQRASKQSTCSIVMTHHQNDSPLRSYLNTQSFHSRSLDKEKDFSEQTSLRTLPKRTIFHSPIGNRLSCSLSLFPPQTKELSEHNHKHPIFPFRTRVYTNLYIYIYTW